MSFEEEKWNVEAHLKTDCHHVIEMLLLVAFSKHKTLFFYLFIGDDKLC
jgi:hypothetical protein